MPLPISLFLVLLLLCGLSLLWLELRHRLRPASPLRLLPGPFQVKRKAQGLELSGCCRGAVAAGTPVYGYDGRKRVVVGGKAMEMETCVLA